MRIQDLTAGQKRVVIGVVAAILGAGTAMALPPGTGGQSAGAPKAGATTNTNTTTTTTTTTNTNGATGTGGATAATTATPPVESKTTATIVFTTAPPARATVMWGKTVLGRIGPGAPLVIRRPRDSGPLDVSVIAAGYLTVHTRAHTFSDNRVSVKLTTPDEKSTLFGYRAPLDAGVPLEDTLNAPTLPGVDVMQQPPL